MASKTERSIISLAKQGSNDELIRILNTIKLEKVPDCTNHFYIIFVDERSSRLEMVDRSYTK